MKTYLVLQIFLDHLSCLPQYQQELLALSLKVLKGRLQKKNGLFSDIDQISFDTHPPHPKDDI